MPFLFQESRKSVFVQNTRVFENIRGELYIFGRYVPGRNISLNIKRIYSIKRLFVKASESQYDRFPAIVKIYNLEFCRIGLQ